MNDSISSREEQGEAIVARSARIANVTPVFRAAISRFSKAHGAYTKACDAVRRATGPRDAAIADLTKCDGSLDEGLLRLAAKMVGAGMTPATSPFKGYSSFAPSAMVGLRFSDEAREAEHLLDRVAAAKPGDAGVKKALAEVRTRLTAAKRALAAIEKPQAQLTSALRARDALIAEWDGALHSVKVQGRAAWESTPERLEALLADVAPALRGSKKRLTVRVPKKKTATKSKPAVQPAPSA